MPRKDKFQGLHESQWKTYFRVFRVQGPLESFHGFQGFQGPLETPKKASNIGFAPQKIRDTIEKINTRENLKVKNIF